MTESVVQDPHCHTIEPATRLDNLIYAQAATVVATTPVITEVTMCSEKGSAPLSSRAKAGCRASRDFA